MNRTFLPSIRETYTDHHSLVELAESQRRLLEEYRGLYTAVLSRIGGESGVVLGVTSAMAGEGKTTVATNIAGAMATDLEKRILLTSCDFQGAATHGNGPDVVRQGLSEYVSGTLGSLDELLVATPLPNLSVLFAGQIPDHASRLIRGERMREALETFRQRFHVTVVDLPPVLRASDTQVLASCLDGVVLVVSLGECSKIAVERALRVLDGVNVVGIAANRVQPTLPRWLSQIVGGSEWAA